MTWGEALALTRTLSKDPASHVGASLAGWTFPASREWLALHVLATNALAKDTEKRPKLRALPAPWDPPPVRRGTASMSSAAMRALLDDHRATNPDDDGGDGRG